MSASSFKPSIDQLESRAVPAAGVSLTSGVLRIEGGSGDDRIFIIQDTATTTNLVAILEQGSTVTRKTFAKSAVTSIQTFGMDGNDTIVNDMSQAMTADGGNGNDQIWGGSGADKLTGSAGNDRLLGRNGNDTIDSGAGDDSLWGGDGNDSMLGGIGADVMVGGSGFDFLDGGDGNDQAWGGDGNDTMIGGSGHDMLQG